MHSKTSLCIIYRSLYTTRLRKCRICRFLFAITTRRLSSRLFSVYNRRRTPNSGGLFVSLLFCVLARGLHVLNLQVVIGCFTSRRSPRLRRICLSMKPKPDITEDDERYMLSREELWWKNRYESVEARGYRMRPRYHPDWVPSWRKQPMKGKKRVRAGDCEDSWRYQVSYSLRWPLCGMSTSELPASKDIGRNANI